MVYLRRLTARYHILQLRPLDGVTFIAQKSCGRIAIRQSFTCGRGPWQEAQPRFDLQNETCSRKEINIKFVKTRLYRNVFTNAHAGSTIFALSTAPGRAAIAIVRCSGPQCLEIYNSLCPGKPPLRPRHAAVRTLHSPFDVEKVLDSQALVLYFPGPQTVTGEDVLEFHVHGGPAIVKAVISAIPQSATLAKGSLPSVRYAEPGEFTRRAFYNGRLDLTQAEALGNSLAAETEQQRSLAISGMSDALQKQYESWRELLLHARGELEALIDFSEDQHFEDSPVDLVRSVSSQVANLHLQISLSMRNAAKGELLRHGIRIALLGAPNAGKSSLLNQIVGREAAIVSSEAGTTRDVIEVNVDVGGYFCKFNDLAGVRSAQGPLTSIGEIEREGIRRAKIHAMSADVVIIVSPVEKDSERQYRVVKDPEIDQFIQTQLRPEQRVLHVYNKADLIEGWSASSGILMPGTADPLTLVPSAFPISCLIAQSGMSSEGNEDPSGMQSFLDGLVKEVRKLTEAEQSMSTDLNRDSPNIVPYVESLAATERQRLLLKQCNEYLEQFLVDVRYASSDVEKGSKDSEEVDIVLAAERLRSAADRLARITGRGEGGDVEEVLGVVFEKFCVGK